MPKTVNQILRDLWESLLHFAESHRFALPAFYAISVSCALIAANALSQSFFVMSRALHLWKDIVFASVTGTVLFALFATLTRSNARNKALIEGSRDLLLFASASGRIVDANEAAVAAYGWPRIELLRLSLSEICGDGDTAPCAAREVLASGGSVLMETYHRRKDGSTFPVEVCATKSTVGRKPVVLMVTRDISDRRRGQSFDRLLHDIDRSILRGIPLDEIFGFVSARLAELFPGSLVQFSLKEDGGSVKIAKCAGSSPEFLDGIHVRWDDSETGQGPTGTAIRTSETQFRRLEEDKGFLPWRERALKLGFKCAAAVPLVARGNCLGALTMLADDSVIDQAAIAALEGFADQVAISVLSAQNVAQLHLQRVALESAANAVVVTDRTGIIQWVNPAFVRLTGYSTQEACGLSPRILKSGNHGDAFYRHMWETLLAGHVWQGELYNRRKDGNLYLEEQTITPVMDEAGGITHFVAIKLDITNRKRQEERIQHLAMHDALTELPNRRLLGETLARAVHRAHRGHQGAFMIVDVDNFKVVNDNLGHAAGDQLLRQLAGLITHALRPGDFVARFGGDEFAVILEDSSLDDAQITAERVKREFDEFRFIYQAHRMAVSASIGLVELDADAEPESVLVHADSALYQAKELGRNRVVVYHEGSDWSTRLQETSKLATRVRDALVGGGLELVFQPIVDLATGATDHYEALLRLRNESGGLETPEQFLRAAEQHGLMPQIDRWVVTRVASVLGEHPDLRIFVNLAGPSLVDEALLEHIEQLIRRNGILPGHLSFEITEATAITDITMAQHWISRLKSLGCFFALDDFGVGFSSLSYLRALAVDFVKIDRSFITDIHEDETSRALVAAVKTVAYTLGKEVIAEGVECEAQAHILRGMGIEHGQGFHWGRPAAECTPGQIIGVQELCLRQEAGLCAKVSEGCPPN